MNMDYETICKYVFANEGIPWELHDTKKRDRELVTARQISIYIRYTLYPDETWLILGQMFSRDHSTAMHAVKNIKDLMFSNCEIRQKIFSYTEALKQQAKSLEETEMKALIAAKDGETLKALLTTIDKMELVAKIYCEITNNKLVKV